MLSCFIPMQDGNVNTRLHLDFLPCLCPSWLALALGAGEPGTVILSHVTNVNDPPI